MKNKMTNRPLILVTNDDGITAPGIRNLVNFMNEIGEVVVVAPNSPQSGKGHAITINSTLNFRRNTTRWSSKRLFSKRNTCRLRKICFR
jgi:5'/3'-nucleotidase SurE